MAGARQALLHHVRGIHSKDEGGRMNSPGLTPISFILAAICSISQRTPGAGDAIQRAALAGVGGGPPPLNPTKAGYVL